MKKTLKLAAALLLCLTLCLTAVPFSTADAFGSVNDPDGNLAISGVDAAGKQVPAASANRDEQVTLRIPLMSIDQEITELRISPVVTTDIDSFPFVINWVNYTQDSAALLAQYGTLKGAVIWEFNFTMTLLHTVTAGTKQVSFDVAYTTVDGVEHQAQLAVFLTVVKGASTGGGGGGTKYYPTPKVIIESYSISANPVYAGEPFTLKMTLTNTSSEEAVQNLQISFTDEAGMILPAENGSNTIYISALDKGASITREISFQSAPDTEPKAYTLGVAFSYDGVKSKQAYTPTSAITIPVLQRVRVKIDDPTIYDEAWVDSECAMYIALYNMGKATIYNCMVDVEGEGLKMAETYFGGNVTSGGTMRADFSVIPSMGGNVEGNVIITYEDVYGTQTTEKRPFTLFVNESYVENGDGSVSWGENGEGGTINVEGTMVDAKGEEGFAGDVYADGGSAADGGAAFPWIYVIIGVPVAAAIALIVVLSLRRKKKAEAAL